MLKTDTTNSYASIITTVPGPNSLKYFNEETKYIAPGIQTIATRSKVTFEIISPPPI